MIKDFIETLFKESISQLKQQRKGTLMFILIITTIIICIDVVYFAHPIDFKNASLLQQILYGLWIFSVISVPVKAYNEHCDKKDAEKVAQKELEEQKTKEIKKQEEKIIQKQKYFKILSYCSQEEIDLLKKFLEEKINTIYVENDEDDYVKTLKTKGIDFIAICPSTHYRVDNLCISVYGREILKEFFDSNHSK